MTYHLYALKHAAYDFA